MKLKIEKGLPIPDTRRSDGITGKTMRDQMKAGDSILLKMRDKQAANVLYQAFGPGGGSMRKLGPNVFRVWRLK